MANPDVWKVLWEGVLFLKYHLGISEDRHNMINLNKECSKDIQFFTFLQN